VLYLGSPMIYYGDEAGMWGANDPDCRKPMLWKELTYEPETFNPDQTKHDPDEVRFNADLFAWYQKFIGLRAKYPSLRLGDFTTLQVDDANKVYAFSRKYGKEEVIVVFNRGDRKATVPVQRLQQGGFKNIFTKATAKQAVVDAMDVQVFVNR
jgi:cyclomaltodextrinase